MPAQMDAFSLRHRIELQLFSGLDGVHCHLQAELGVVELLRWEVLQEAGDQTTEDLRLVFALVGQL